MSFSSDITSDPLSNSSQADIFAYKPENFRNELRRSLAPSLFTILNSHVNIIDSQGGPFCTKMGVLEPVVSHHSPQDRSNARATGNELAYLFEEDSFYSHASSALGILTDDKPMSRQDWNR